MSKQKSAIGVVLCAPCPKQELERIAARLGNSLLTADAPATPRQLADLAARVAKRGFAKVLLAGISPVRQAELIRSFARQARLAPGAVLGIDLDPALHAKPRAAAVLRALEQGLAALAESPLIETRRLPLQAAVLVVGGGPAGLQAASSLRALGHPVTIVEKEAGKAPGIVRQAFDLKGVTLLAGSRVLRIEGQVGAFTATVRTAQGDRRLDCGAVVLAVGVHEPPAGEMVMFNATGVVGLDELADAAGRLPRRRGVRSLAVILDYRLDETKASTEGALKTALALQEKGFQAHLFCRDVRVAAMELERLYDRAREAGVDIVKYDGELSLRPGAGKAVKVTYRDGILGETAGLECELVGVSPYGMASAADPELASLAGVTRDALGQLQANNIHLFPGETNRPGIFAAGACRGQFYLPQIRAEAKAVALAVHALLAPGAQEVELAQPVVDADKCALCLTCVRSCPHGAMFIDRAKGAAASSPEACRRCGICAGECPAKAIELPAWSDRVVLSQVR